MRAAAEDLDLRQRQQRRAIAAQVAIQRQAAPTPRRHAPRPSTPPAWRWRRAATCPACRPARSGARRARPGRRRRGRPARARDLAVARGPARAARRGRRRPRRRRAGRAPRACRWSAGRRDGAADAAVASVTSASTVGRPRLSQTRRAWMLADAGGAHASDLPSPGVRHVRQPVDGLRPAARGRHGARRRAALRRSGTRPATCRPPAPAAGPGSSARGALLQRVGSLPVDAGQVGRGQRVEAGQEGRRPPPGVHRHFSSRWFRQKARSKAGSPHQAHSASRNTGPCGRDQDVLRADVAMHQRAWLAPACACTSALQLRRQVGVRCAVASR